MQKIYDYSVNRYLSEIQAPLTDAMLMNKTCVLLAAMGTGKSTLIETYIVPLAKKFGKWVIFVIPGVIQLKQMSLRGIEIVCDGSNCSGDKMFYGTTPDSMHKVMEASKEKGKDVWLIVDEAHAVVTSSGFRESFLNIDKYATQCERVIRMTATIDPLERWDLGPIFRIKKDLMPQVNVTLKPVEKINADTIHKIAADRFIEGEALYTHYNNIEENTVIAEKLSKLITQKQEKVLVENHQEDIYETEPQFKIIDHTEKAVSLHAKNKNVSASQALIKGEELKDVAILCMTSFVKEGMNIYNKKPSTIIIVWDKTLTYAELIQIFGRYRLLENIKEIVVIIKAYEKKTINFKPFETLLEEERAIIEGCMAGVNSIKNVDTKTAQEFAERNSLVFDEETRKFSINEAMLRNRVYQRYSDAMRRSPDIIKKTMEDCSAVNLKVRIEDTTETCSVTELQEEVKENKIKSKEKFQNLLNEIITYDDKTIEELLDYTINGRLPEMQEAYQNMQQYHKIADKKFKKALKNMIEIGEMKPGEAFRELVVKGERDYQDVFDERYAKVINGVIKNIGIEAAEKQFVVNGFKRDKKTEIAPRTVLIRKYLQEHEKKRSRLSKVLITKLVEIMVTEGYYGLKSSTTKIDNEQDPTIKARMIEDLHKKNLAKARTKLLQDLENVYTLKNDNKGKLISSIKLTN